MRGGGTNSIDGCLNLGDVIAEGDAEGYISGLVYSNTSNNSINQCMNMGRVLSYSKEASLVYFLSGKTTISYCLDVSRKALFGRESSYYGQPEYEGIYYLTDGVQFDVTPEEKKEGISEMTLEEMRDPAFAEALGERYIAAPGSYPLLKKYVCDIHMNTEDGAETVVRDAFGNEILGDGTGNPDNTPEEERRTQYDGYLSQLKHWK